MKEILNEFYTTRWYISKVIDKIESSSSFDPESSLVNELKSELKILESKIENFPKDGANNEIKLWYPEAVVPDFKQNTLGKYINNYPKGLIVHYIVAPQIGGKEKAIEWAKFGKDRNYVFFTIGKDGTIVQSFPLDSWGQHAGESYWEGLGHSVSQQLVGVEILCEGKIQFFDDVGKWGHLGSKKSDGTYERRYVNTKEEDIRTFSNSKGNIAKGNYEKYTVEQEESLIKLILWLKKNNPAVFNLDFVLGHDEVAGPSGLGKVNDKYENSWRKVDPGASLSMTMEDFRNLLKDKYSEM